MEKLVYPEKADKNRVIREKIETYNSSGQLYLHPDFQFYYTEGVQYVISFLEDDKQLMNSVMGALALFGENDFIVIRLRRRDDGNNWLEFYKRNEEVLLKAWIPVELPLEYGFSLCFYFVGRTLLLPTEY